VRGGGLGETDPPTEVGGVGDIEPLAESGGGDGDLSAEPGGDGDNSQVDRTSVGGLEDSRLASLVAVRLEEVSAKLTTSPPVRRDVTSHSTHVPARIGPDESTAGVTRGLLRYVRAVSPQELVSTPCTSMPVELLLPAKARRTPVEMGASRSPRSNRRKLRTSGVPSVRSAVPPPKFRRTLRLLAYVSASAT
jgi:hypothetical protein